MNWPGGKRPPRRGRRPPARATSAEKVLQREYGTRTGSSPTHAHTQRSEWLLPGREPQSRPHASPSATAGRTGNKIGQNHPCSCPSARWAVWGWYGHTRGAQCEAGAVGVRVSGGGRWGLVAAVLAPRRACARTSVDLSNAAEYAPVVTPACSLEGNVRSAHTHVRPLPKGACLVRMWAMHSASLSTLTTLLYLRAYLPHGAMN